MSDGPSPDLHPSPSPERSDAPEPTETDRESALLDSAHPQHPRRWPRRLLIGVAVTLALLGAILGEQWARARTASSLIELADEFARSGLAHRIAWQELTDFTAQENNTVVTANAAEWADLDMAIAEKAGTTLTDLIELRLEVQGVFVLPWHRSAAKAKQRLVEDVATVEEALRAEVREFAYARDANPDDVIDATNAVLNGWRPEVPELCAGASYLKGQLHASIPSAPWLWDALHHNVPSRLSGSRPYAVMPWTCYP